MSGAQRFAAWLALAAALQLALAPRAVAIGAADCAGAGGCCAMAPIVDAGLAAASCCAVAPLAPACCGGDGVPERPEPAPERGDEGCPCEHRDAPDGPARPEALPVLEVEPAARPQVHSIWWPAPMTVLAARAPGARPPDATGPPRYLRLCRWLI